MGICQSNQAKKTSDIIVPQYLESQHSDSPVFINDEKIKPDMQCSQSFHEKHHLNNESMIINSLKITNTISSGNVGKEYCNICHIEFDNMLDYHHHLQVS